VRYPIVIPAVPIPVLKTPNAIVIEVFTETGRRSVVVSRISIVEPKKRK
jgi:hypothetical protein